MITIFKGIFFAVAGAAVTVAVVAGALLATCLALVVTLAGPLHVLATALPRPSWLPVGRKPVARTAGVSTYSPVA